MLPATLDLKVWFPEADGFPRPAWPAIRAWIKQNVAADQVEAAWQAIVLDWLDRLRERLGPTYAVAESEHFQLLADLDSKGSRHLLEFLEKSRARMLRELGDLSPGLTYGKHVVLRFGEQDDYYCYVSYFDPDGEYAGSSGRFLRGPGYSHIAYPHQVQTGADSHILVHELTHNLLARLPLPLWLNEALAMAFEADITGYGLPLVTRELAAEHAAYWNARTIQEFWSGRSFASVEGQTLSYSLARIFLNLIATDLRPTPGQFRGFLLQANRADGGRSAAQATLDLDLADLVATFLGPGDWEPRRDEGMTETPARS